MEKLFVSEEKSLVGLTPGDHDHGKWVLVFYLNLEVLMKAWLCKLKKYLPCNFLNKFSKVQTVTLQFSEDGCWEEVQIWNIFHRTDKKNEIENQWYILIKILLSWPKNIIKVSLNDWLIGKLLRRFCSSRVLDIASIGSSPGRRKQTNQPWPVSSCYLGFSSSLKSFSECGLNEPLRSLGGRLSHSRMA